MWKSSIDFHHILAGCKLRPCQGEIPKACFSIQLQSDISGAHKVHISQVTGHYSKMNWVTLLPFLSSLLVNFGKQMLNV